MKPGHLLFTGLIASLTATAARAGVYPFADYHLGEEGTVLGVETRPQDSSGAKRHFTSSQGTNDPALISTDVSPAAIGSTACLDTRVAGHQYWSGFETFSNLPTNNFAFGIFAKTPAGDYTQVFALGDQIGAYTITSSPVGWYASQYRGGYIAGLPGTFTPDAWTHLAVIRNAGVTRFYINGVDQGGSFTLAPVHRDAMLSRNFYQESFSTFNGLLDEARVVTFTEGEPTANILAALQAGAVTPVFKKVGATASVPKANLLPVETSVFRIGGAVQDFVQVTEAGGLQVGGTAPEKHVIQIVREGKIANGRYPLIGFTGTIGGQGLAGLQLAEIPGRITETLEINAANSTIDLVISGAEGVTWSGAANSLWNKHDTNWKLGDTSTATQFMDADDVKFDDSAAGTTNVITVSEAVAPGAVTVDASENYSFSGAGISFNGPLTKKGTGTLAIANAITSSSGVAVQGGTLSVGDGGAVGSLGSGPVTLSNGGQLLVNRNGDVTLPNAISGSGSIGKLGAGTLTISSPVSLSGVTLATGRIAAGRSGLFPSVAIAAGASLDYKGFSPGSTPPTISGNGVNGEGAILNTGVAFSMQETLVLGGDASVGGNMGMMSRGPVTYYDPYPASYPCSISGNYKLTKVGSGTFSFYKTTVTVKDIVINEGSILADHFSTINNTNPGTITINNGASLEFGNTFTISNPSVTGATCAKPILLNGGTLAVSGGPFHGLSIPSGVQLSGPGGTLIADRFPSSNGGTPMPMAGISLGTVAGTGSLTVGGSGIVSVGQPAYTGDTTILAQPGNAYLRGRLSLGTPGLADTSTVNIADGAILGLNFNGTDTVRRLFINGVQQQPGVYDQSHISGRILGTGTLTVTEGPAAPPYELWAQANGIAGASPNADSDGDGISNSVEFVIGGDPSGPNSDSSALLPVMTRSDNVTKFVYRRTHAASVNYTMKVEVSSDLSPNSWASPVESIYDQKTLVESDGFGPGVDKVSVTLDLYNVWTVRQFARLKVEIP